jgi:hypothetical protein
LDDEETRHVLAPLTALAAAEAHRQDLVPTIEGLLRDRRIRRDDWVRMMTATALVSLGRPRHVLTLFEVLNHGTMGGQYVPSVLLDPVLIPPAATALCLRTRLVDGTDEERETAAWMAPYARSSFARELLGASSDSVFAVRRAASWAVAAHRVPAGVVPAADASGG